MTDWLREYGKTVLSNGYSIVPIRPRGDGESEKAGKAPGTLVPWTLFGAWQNLSWDAAAVEKSVLTGNGACGIGIHARETPGVDLDILDANVVDQMRAFVEKRLGRTIERVGNAPKTLLVYRALEPFKKVTSKKYEKGRVEILGDGQQFLALATHPITGAPYIWKNGVSVADVETWELPVITRDDAIAICDEFDRLAANAGWPVLAAATRSNYSADNPFVSDSPKVTDMTLPEMKKVLDRTPGYDDYHTWCQVGMALFHQFEGSEDGLEWWLDWSEMGHEFQNGDPCREKWESGTFEVEGKSIAPTTFRTIIKLADEAAEERTRNAYNDALTAILASKSTDDLEAACRLCRPLEISEFDRNRLATKVRETYKAVSDGATILATAAARMVRYTPVTVADAPEWLDGYVYVTADKSFYSLITGRALREDTFDAVHGRLMLTRQERLEGKTVPEHRASNAALNRHEIPTVEDLRYMPDLPDRLFTLDDIPYANSYSERGLPATPAVLTSTGSAAIERVERHVRHLIDNERDADLFVSFLAYVVQTKRRVNWGVFLQGTQGDGKTFFSIMMGALLGASNVKIVKGSSLEEKYTSWAEAALMVFIEEVRLGGENKYKVIDHIKPYITNPVVPIRRMHRDEYTVPNKASYFLISNFRDALPVGDEDNRYAPFFSRWQDQDALAAFRAANPRYYNDLYGSLTEAGSLRKWLLGYKLSPLFDPDARAPLTSHKAEMTEAASDPAVEVLKELIRSGNEPDFCPTLVRTSAVNDRLYERDTGIVLPGKKLHAAMQKAGFTSLGKPIKVAGRPETYWSIVPERFRRLSAQGLSETDPVAIRSYLENEL